MDVIYESEIVVVLDSTLDLAEMWLESAGNDHLGHSALRLRRGTLKEVCRRREAVETLLEEHRSNPWHPQWIVTGRHSPLVLGREGA